MLDFGTKIHCRKELWDDDISVYLGEKQGDVFSVAQPLTMKELPQNSLADPFLRLRIEDAQRLMDELWNCGIRPSEGTGSAGSLAATEKHLKDLQNIVFDLLGRLPK